MEVPGGFVGALWNFVSFLPFFFLLLLLGLLKAAIICPIVLAIIGIANPAVIIGLWPAHFLWTYFCLLRTKRIGPVLKIAVLIALPVPLILWPAIGISGSVLGGIGYGFFTPLIATFEAVGKNATDKCYHCFVDGSLSTIKGSCMAVQDFTDFCFHSYFSFMDDLSEKMPENEKPKDIKLSKLPSCLLASLIAIPVDVLLITAVALYKSPFMLFKGWKRLLEDLIGREGPFLETVCVPFAALAIFLWPLAVVGALIAAIISSFFLGLYAGVIVHQEDSLHMGLAYVISAVSLFDEYVNDLLDLKEGSCLPRPRYRHNMNPNNEKNLGENGNGGSRLREEGSINTKLISERSRTLKWAIQQYRPVQVWDWLFKSCEVNGRILLRDELINLKDIEECIVKGNCKKLGIKLPAWSILQCLLISAKFNSPGLVISDDLELTKNNSPRDKVFEWFIGPLLIIKEQLKKMQLDVDEELSLRKLVMECNNEKPEDWDDSGFSSNDNVRKAQMQAIIRRLQGIVASMSRLPTFRRRFKNLVKILYMEAVQAGESGNHIGGIVTSTNHTGGIARSSCGTNNLTETGGRENNNGMQNVSENRQDNGDIV